MPMTRCKSQLPAPPPSPIPTGRGIRSAANEIFSEYIEKTLQLPELTLPESHFPPITHLPVPVEIDIRSLPFGASQSVDLLLRSAKEFGAFRISGHGISGHEVGAVVDEAEDIFEETQTNAGGIANVAVERSCNGEIIRCAYSRKGTFKFTARKNLEAHQTHFWKYVESVASRLDGIVQQVSLALQDEAREEFKEQIQDTESVICLCRYPHDSAERSDADASSDDRNLRLCEHALRLYLPLEHCIFYVKSGRGPISFDAGPDSVVVTIGKQLEEWSGGEFKCFLGEMIFMPSFQSSRASFSIELKCSSSNLSRSLKTTSVGKIISISDQILIALCFCFLYKFLQYFFFS